MQELTCGCPEESRMPELPELVSRPLVCLERPSIAPPSGAISRCCADDLVEYCAVAGFPNYRVGRDGSVWSRARGDWRKLKPVFRGSRGKRYACVCLFREGKQSPRHVHHIILEAFVGARPSGMHGCHNNGNRLDNQASNLRWDTPANNQADRVLHGTDECGSKSPRAILNESQVLEICERLCRRDRTTEIASDFGVGAHVVYKIKKGKSWRHITADRLQLETPAESCSV